MKLPNKQQKRKRKFRRLRKWSSAKSVTKDIKRRAANISVTTPTSPICILSYLGTSYVQDLFVLSKFRQQVQTVGLQVNLLKFL